MSEEQAGFDAIAAALKALYPGQKGLYYGVLMPYALGGPDPLDGVEIYKSGRGIPHWHYVTYGFSELYEKESPNPGVSGYGFELTFRLKRGPEEQPPIWPVNLLQNLARYVFQSGNVFEAGHHINLNGPVALEEDTLLEALGFMADPELGEMDTPNGRLTFLQAAALTLDEMNALMCWQSIPFLSLLERRVPLHITDLSRGSLMEDPAIRAAWEEGVARDGSSTGFFYTDELGWCQTDRGWRIRLGAGHGLAIRTMLQARVGKGRPFGLIGPKQRVQFCPGEAPLLQGDGDGLTLTLHEPALKELCALLQPRAVTLDCTQLPLSLDLVPTVIRDRNGNVTRIIQ